MWYGDPSFGYGGGYGMPQAGGYGMLPWQNPQYQQDAYNPIGSLIKSGAAAKYNLQGMDIKPMQDIGTQIAALGRAQYDDTDPLYQRTYEAERGAGMQDLAAAIAEIGRQNRKLSMNGRTPLFSPERGGEQQFRQLTQGYQNVQNDARMRARQILGVGQQAAGRTFDAYSTITGLQDQNKQKKAKGMFNIGDMIPLLKGGMF